LIQIGKRNFKMIGLPKLIERIIYEKK